MSSKVRFYLLIIHPLLSYPRLYSFIPDCLYLSLMMLSVCGSLLGPFILLYSLTADVAHTLSHYAWPSNTAVQLNYRCGTGSMLSPVSVHLYSKSWCQPGLSRGLESKLILTNESTSNITCMNHINQSQMC
jgi:hypothetical protein